MCVLRLTCAGFVFDQWTLVPGQRLLERLGKVEKTPPNDDIVVERHEETHLQSKKIRQNSRLLATTYQQGCFNGLLTWGPLYLSLNLCLIASLPLRGKKKTQSLVGIGLC